MTWSTSQAAPCACGAQRPQVEPLEQRRLMSGDVPGATLVPEFELYDTPVPASAAAFEVYDTPVFAALELARPSVTGSSPSNGATNVPRNAFVSAYVRLPNVGAGVSRSTLTSSNVKLYRTGDTTRTPVAATLNTSAAGDVIVLTPTSYLAASTKYTFEVTSGLKDTSGTAFLPFAMSFTTGTGPSPTSTTIGFNKVSLPTATNRRFSGLTVGPDGRLYAATLDGEITRFDIRSDGTLSSATVINTVRNHNGGRRMITGLHFDPASTSSNLVLWVTHNHGAELNAPDWTGKLSRLSGSSLQNYQDYVVGLPRSVRDHLSNQIEFGPDGKLYLAQGSNTAMGAPDNAWGLRPERLLSAAILKVDTRAVASRIAAGQGALNVQTEAGRSYNPYAPGAAVTIYATGVRNAYDLVWHSNGSLYVPTNGSAPGGNTPAGGGAPALNNLQMNEPDWLFRVRAGKYYGHPNPKRGEYVLNGGNPTSGTDKYQVGAYPVGVKPDPDWDPAVYSFGNNRSPNGVIEFKSGNFGGKLKGCLIVCRYSGGDDLLILRPDGGGYVPSANVQSGAAGMTGFVDPLDIAEHVGRGNLYVIEHGARKITLLKPKG